MNKIYKHNILVEGAIPLDSKYYNDTVPYTSTSQANGLIPSYSRYVGLTVNINGVEYWYSGGIADGNLIRKIFDVTLQIATDNGNTTTNDIILNGGILGTNGATFSKNYYFSNSVPSSSLGSNIVIGHNATVGGNHNTVMGHNAMSGTSAEYNIAIGEGALSLQTGSFNTAIGYAAGFQQKGQYNVIIGFAGNSTATYNYSYMFGNQAISTASGQVIFSKDGTIMWRIGTDLLTTSRLHKAPNSNGTFTVSVNGIAADDNGNISVPVIAASNTVTRETPSGTIDGINDTFTLAYTPVPGTEHVYVNGVLQDEGSGNDYTISGDTIIFETGSIPQPAGTNPSDDKIRVSYIK